MQSAGSLAAAAAARARDPGFEGATETQVISLLSYSQQIVNGMLSDVTGSAVLTLTPGPPLYQLSTVLPAAVKVLAIRDIGGQDLTPLGPHEALIWTDFAWLRAVSDTPRAWTVFGRDLLVIYPGVTVSHEVEVIYGELTPVLAQATDDTVVPNEDDDAVLDLTEILLLLKSRDLSPMQDALSRFAGRLRQLSTERR